MGLFAGLSVEDRKYWGQFTTFKVNSPELLRSANTRNAVVYCSPLVDPYQPAERDFQMMPKLIAALLEHPVRAFTIQTRAPLILRDLKLLKELARMTSLRVSMSVTTDDDTVRKRYEPHCEPNDERLAAITALRENGIETYATLAPLLPCHPEWLAELALGASQRTLIGDPLHVRETKRHGATTREVAAVLAERFGEEKWLNPKFQADVVARIRAHAEKSGFGFEVGPRGFSVLGGASLSL